MVLQEVPVRRSLVDSDLPHSSHPSSLLHQQQVEASQKTMQIVGKEIFLQKDRSAGEDDYTRTKEDDRKRQTKKDE